MRGMRRLWCQAPAALLAATALLCAPASSHAFEIEKHPETDVTNHIAGTPPRQEIEVKPGERLEVEVGFQNRLGRPVDFTIEVKDIGGRPDAPQDLFALTDDAPFGASGWVTVDRKKFTLEQGDIGRIKVTAQAPADAEPGSYYAAVAGYGAPPKSDGAGGGAAQAAISAGVGVQLFFNIPGERRHAGTITSASSRRLIWRDQHTFVPLDVHYQNRGNVTDIVGGKVALEGLFGREVGAFRQPGQVVLRGGTREYRFLWTDPPWIGRFTPTVEFVGEGGKPVIRELPAVWIVPSWKYLLAALLAIGLPTWWRLRERRKVRQLRAELDHVRARERADDPDGWLDAEDLDDDEEWSSSHHPVG